MNRPLAPSLVVVALLIACGGGGGGGDRRIGPNPCDTGAACGQVALSLDAVNAGLSVRSTAGVRLAGFVEASWLSGGIISGPPDALTLRVTRILAAPAGGGDLIPVFESTAPRGTPVTLTTGAVNLATALGATGFKLPPGTYERLDLEVSRVAEITGCVSGAFQPTDAVTGKVSDVNPSWAASAPLHASNTYSNDPITDGLTHEFCTKTTPNEVSVGTFTEELIGYNEDFEAVTDPVPTEIDLALDNAGNLGADALRASVVTVSSPGTFTVAQGGEVDLKLAMDLNRMLRFFANTRSDLGAPNPNMKGGTSYFFTTVFPFSTVLVPDDGGTIEGYEFTVTALKAGGSEPVPGWLTVIRAPGGAVLGGVVMGDDDNGLTVAKGNLDPIAADDGSGNWTLDYGLGSGEGGAPFVGHIVDFRFLDVGQSGTCTLTVESAPWLSNFTGFTCSYSRVL